MATHDSTPARVAIYARVSTKNSGQDPETQLLALREYAQARKLEVFSEYTDVGISAHPKRHIKRYAVWGGRFCSADEKK